MAELTRIYTKAQLDAAVAAAVEAAVEAAIESAVAAEQVLCNKYKALLSQMEVMRCQMNQALAYISMQKAEIETLKCAVLARAFNDRHGVRCVPHHTSIPFH